jgi:serine/threonine-protein kinase
MCRGGVPRRPLAGAILAAVVRGNDLSGSVLDDRYEVFEPIAEGAMGAVYRGERVKLGRAVAIKIMHDALPDELASRQRFEREAKLMARLEHPHCVSVIDFGLHDGKPYLVMELVRGTSLLDELARITRFPPARAAELVRQVLSGLGHAHELGIVHRDIKPANIMITERTGLGEQVRILDFGLARPATDSTKLTTGIVVGTPNYMAPEQIKGGAIDARADLYAVGVLLFELLTGTKPFLADDPLAVVRKHLHQAPPSLADVAPGIPFGELEDVVARALMKAPPHRFANAAEMSSAIDQAIGKRASTAEMMARSVPQRAATTPSGRIDSSAKVATESGWNVPEVSASQVVDEQSQSTANAPHTAPPHGSGPNARPNPQAGNIGSGPNTGAPNTGFDSRPNTAPHPGSAPNAPFESRPNAAPHPGSTSNAPFESRPNTAPHPGSASNAPFESRPNTGPHAGSIGGSVPNTGAPNVGSGPNPGAPNTAFDSRPNTGPHAGSIGPGSAPNIGAPNVGSGPNTGAPNTAFDSRPNTAPHPGSAPNAPFESRPNTAPHAGGSLATNDSAAQTNVALGTVDMFGGVPAPIDIPPTRRRSVPPTRINHDVPSTRMLPIPGIPLTRTHLLIGGGVLVLVIIAIAAAKSGSTTKPAPIVAAGSAAIVVDAVATDPVAPALARASDLYANGDLEPALDVVTKARRQHPDSSQLAFLDGKIYFAKLWWTDGVKAFRDAIRLDGAYRNDPELLKIVLRGFITTPDIDSRIEEFIREDLGEAAKPGLAETAKSHPNASIRSRAAGELRRLENTK